MAKKRMICSADLFLIFSVITLIFGAGCYEDIAPPPASKRGVTMIKPIEPTLSYNDNKSDAVTAWLRPIDMDIQPLTQSAREKWTRCNVHYDPDGFYVAAFNRGDKLVSINIRDYALTLYGTGEPVMTYIFFDENGTELERAEGVMRISVQEKDYGVFATAKDCWSNMQQLQPLNDGDAPQTLYGSECATGENDQLLKLAFRLPRGWRAEVDRPFVTACYNEVYQSTAEYKFYKWPLKYHYRLRDYDFEERNRKYTAPDESMWHFDKDVDKHIAVPDVYHIGAGHPALHIVQDAPLDLHRVVYTVRTYKADESLHHTYRVLMAHMSIDWKKFPGCVPAGVVLDY